MRPKGGAGGSEVKGRDQSVGFEEGGGAGWEGSPDLYSHKYQSALHLAVSKPLQRNNKPWTLFDPRRLQMETGQQMHACWNWGEAVDAGVCGVCEQRVNRANRSWVFCRKRPPLPSLLALRGRRMGVKAKTGNSTFTQKKRARVNNQMSDT